MIPSEEPTRNPTRTPTDNPTYRPTKNPTSSQTSNPTFTPTDEPSYRPTMFPTESPTDEPTSHPTRFPTKSPTELPTSPPTRRPTLIPSDKPTNNPTLTPTDEPTYRLTEYPSETPTVLPTDQPTLRPKPIPTAKPTSSPTPAPMDDPTYTPTKFPTESPTVMPTSQTRSNCVVRKEWKPARAEELCPGEAHHAYGVRLCYKYNNPDYQRRLEFALANKLWASCNHMCLYDYDSYNTDNPHAFRWTGKCYKVVTGKFCIERETNEMEQSHAYAGTLCETTEPCVEIVEWTQKVAETICPDGYSKGDKGWGTARVCPDLVRSEDGFYVRADVLYGASFNRSLANHMFISCGAKCLYDIENEGVVYQWKKDCWKMQTKWACITTHTTEYKWALNYLSERMCAVTKPVISQCFERENNWNEEIANKICSTDDFGITNKGVNAKVCRGFPDYQHRLEYSLANRAYLSCNAWCVYDVSKNGYNAFMWKKRRRCWRPVSNGYCIRKRSNDRQKIIHWIKHKLCAITKPKQTQGPTCIEEQEWSEELMDGYCSVSATGFTYKHYHSIGRAAVPCSGFEKFSGDLLKSLAMKMYDKCSSWCVYDYFSGAQLAWKWSPSTLCWKLVSWGSCHWDFFNRKKQKKWNDAKLAIDSLCKDIPTSSPTKCMPYNTWTEERAKEICPMDDIIADKRFGVKVCDGGKSAKKQANLEKSLANNFFVKCTSWCVYDYDTVMKNIQNDIIKSAGFIWNRRKKCWRWVTRRTCFTLFNSEFVEVTKRAEAQCIV